MVQVVSSTKSAIPLWHRILFRNRAHLISSSADHTLTPHLILSLSKPSLHSSPRNSTLAGASSPQRKGRALEPKMAVATATTASATAFTATRVPKARVVRHVSGLSSFGGLKAHNCVASLGVSASTEQSFTNIVSSLRSSNRNAGKGGALGSTCNAASEIFRIAAIMNGLVLIGVAVGFVLLRIEASVEEAE